jgi:hypothetical protein
MILYFKITNYLKQNERFETISKIYDSISFAISVEYTFATSSDSSSKTKQNIIIEFNIPIAKFQ